MGGTAVGGTAVVAAVDVGGTTIKAALVGPDLQVIRGLQRPTPQVDGPGSVIDAICDVLATLETTAATPPRAAGVVVPGIVDDARGRVVFSANLGWRDLALRSLLAERSGSAIAFGHDVRAGALAEVALGAAKGAASALFVPIGTGIAGAFVVDGRPLVSGGYAGEIGHVAVEPDGTLCGCGARGCLETVASATALARRYTEITGTPVAGAADVCERMLAGDRDARWVWDFGIDALAGVLATAVTLLGPDMIVVGGGLSGAGDVLVDPLRESLAKRLTFQRMPQLVVAALGDQASCLGAALLARQIIAQSQPAQSP